MMKIPCTLTINSQGELKLQLNNLTDDMANFLEDVDFEVVERDFWMGKAHRYSVTYLLKPHRPIAVTFNQEKTEAYLEYTEVEVLEPVVTVSLPLEVDLTHA